MINKYKNAKKDGYWEETWNTILTDDRKNHLTKIYCKGYYINGEEVGYWQYYSFDSANLISKVYYV